MKLTGQRYPGCAFDKSKCALASFRQAGRASGFWSFCRERKKSNEIKGGRVMIPRNQSSECHGSEKRRSFQKRK